MKYVVLKGTVIGGKQVRVGDVVDVPDSEVSGLISTGRIDAVKDKQTKTVDRAVGLEEETKPKTRTRKKKAD